MSTLNRLTPWPRPARAVEGMEATNEAYERTRAATRSDTEAPAVYETLDLNKLLGNAQGINIAHNGHVYRLQITKACKLILTK